MLKKKILEQIKCKKKTISNTDAGIDPSTKRPVLPGIPDSVLPVLNALLPAVFVRDCIVICLRVISEGKCGYICIYVYITWVIENVLRMK